MRFTSADGLEEALAGEPSPEAFFEVLSALHAASGGEAAELERVEAALADWPDDVRLPPDDVWRSIQAGGEPPRWWPLVRHLRVAADDTLAPSLDLTGVTSVDAKHHPMFDPSPLRRATRLRSLDLSGSLIRGGLEFLRGTPHLEELDLSYLEFLPPLDPLTQLARLRALNLAGNPDLRDLSPLARAPALRRLDLSGNDRLERCDALAALPDLQTLALDGCASLRSLAFLKETSGLRELHARGLDALADLSPVASAGVVTFALGGRSIIDGAPIGRMRALEDLTLAPLPGLGALTFLKGARQLRRLSVISCPVKLPGLDLPDLEALEIDHCPSVTELGALTGLSSLRELSLSDLSVSDLSPLAGLARLDTLWLAHCPFVTDLTVLARLPLRRVFLAGSNRELDTASLPAGCKVER